jgi:transposase
MSAQELGRVDVMSRVAAGALTLRSAAQVLDVSYRQAKRIWRRYRDGGARALVHRHVGRRSNRGRQAGERDRVLALIREKYSGEGSARFGPTLAAEHLASEDGIAIDHETLRRWMLVAGLWHRRRQRSPYRHRRERKAHCGELVQLDGSQHAWLEGRGPSGCAMTLVDDATGRVLLQFAPQETTWAAADVLRAWIAQYGVPRALYTDWKNVYVRRPTEAERLAAIVPLTQFGRMCADLGIQIIPASSPQAKGRIERQHGTQQDRLIKKLRRAGITTYDAANAFVADGYLADHNARFARAAASAEDFHRRSPPTRALDRIFTVQETRTLSNDWVVRYRNRFLQLERVSSRMPARSTVQVCEARDGQITIRYRERALAWREITPGACLTAAASPVPTPIAASTPDGRGRRTAGADHPWRRRFVQWPSRSHAQWLASHE